MPLPSFTASGDLPSSVHRATLSEVLERFGSGSPQRMEARLLFDHAMAHWQITREGSYRGIVEIIPEFP